MNILKRKLPPIHSNTSDKLQLKWKYNYLFMGYTFHISYKYSFTNYTLRNNKRMIKWNLR